MITIRIKKADNGEYYASIYSSNGKQIWKTSETYKRKRTVDRAIDIISHIMDKGFNIIDETK